ncbi:MAG: DUF1592 domain-containing protein [Planctomycetota bacterium]|nr:DUF1592 domain-containing protein [Planctomycetota bacterium]
MKTVGFLFAVVLAGLPVASQERSRDGLQAFIELYCAKCHGADSQKADRRLDHLSLNTSDLENVELLQEVLDQLNLAEMPPQGEKQPPTAILKKVVADLTETLAKARLSATENGGKVILRRLNRVEYRNTIRDLFQLKMIDFDPTITFPPDDATDGFDNIGEGLVASDYLLQNYLEAARLVADKAIRPGPRPEIYHERLKGEAIGGARQGFGGEAARMFIKFRQPLALSRLDKRRGVSADGEYVIRFKAKSHQRKSRYKDEDLRYNSDEPMRLSITIDSRELGPTAHRVIAEYDIPDEKVVEIEHRVWLERGFTFHLHWANGPNGSFKRILRKVLPKYRNDAVYPIRNPPEMYIGSGPELHVYSIELEGPFYEQWPPAGFARYFPNPPKELDAKYLESSLLRLANRAFRRPVQRDEIASYLDLSKQYLEQHGDFWAAAKYGIRGLLTSPHFLYLVEPAPTEPGNRVLSSHELATRLSYFLWSSMPDDQLRAAADNNTLHRENVLRDQVQRMLRDPKSSGFAQNFTSQWLGLRQLGEMPPDPQKNRSYYDDQLENAMRLETQLFVAHVLYENRSILDFIDSNYTFLNAALARHYAIPNVEHDDFRKVLLQKGSHRGGLLGHASILTATSNGVETQPVIRGVWVLDNLLGTPPSPPPPDVEPIEPDTRGVQTIRELMAKHRNNPTCHECHRKIDPIGLSMENYDYVGAWRERGNNKQPIDATGKMPDGTTISGTSGIKQYLLKRPDQFTRCLTEKLLIYALGRRLSFTDRDEIDRIVTTLPRNHYGFQDLILQIVTGKAFQSK